VDLVRRLDWIVELRRMRCAALRPDALSARRREGAGSRRQHSSTVSQRVAAAGNNKKQNQAQEKQTNTQSLTHTRRERGRRSTKNKMEKREMKF